MTIICYDSKLRLMASDSLCATSNGYFLSKTKKLFRLPSGAIIGTAGDDDCRSVLGLLGDCETAHDLPSRNDLAFQHTDFMGLLVLPDNSVFQVDCWLDYSIPAGDPWRGAISEISERYSAVGHGMDFALPILHSGGTVQDAVKMACKFSRFCALPIQTLKLEPLPKQKKQKGPIPVVSEPSESE